MSRGFLRAAACIASGVLFTSAALAQRQTTTTERAPVPKQVLTARTAFIGNGGGESYGAESYFRLTKYDGGPNRAYNSFYNAMKDWGHYALLGSTREADVSLVIRFANPVVDPISTSTASEPTRETTYDPQLDLSINDPATGLTLWTITEHIEPGNDRAADNRHFDEAVSRLVDDLERLILAPEGNQVAENVIPPGAVRLELRRRRETHAVIAGLLGGLVGGFAGSRTAQYACPANTFTMPTVHQGPFFPNTPLPEPPPLPDFSCTVHRNGIRVRNEIIGSVGGALIGAMVGWVWPVSF